MEEMSISTKTNLCKGLRACGIPQHQAHEIQNIIEKWYKNNGASWVNQRIKDLRQWYERYLTGKPEAPEWFRHTQDDLPTGIWNWVFHLPTAKALGVLSLNTVFYESEFTQEQRKKFLHGLEGNGTQDKAKLDSYLRMMKHPFRFYGKQDKMPMPNCTTIFDMNGSVPTHDGRSSRRPNGNWGEALIALSESMDSIPQVTFDFLDRMDYLWVLPQDVLGNEYQLELNRPHSSVVGRVSVLQQPQLKARVVGNPNRVTQVTLEPLKELYMRTARNLPTDVTFDQESGVRWVQEKLRQGIELAGSDMTSASDLLDVELCLSLVDTVFSFTDIADYQEYADYFVEVCRAAWFCPALDSNVYWKQGDVLGTGPSFGLLTLSNNASALLAAKAAIRDGRLPRETSVFDCFRVVGDDIIMRSEMAPYYTDVIESLGGEINHLKTLTSDRVAEFAGRVITSNGAYLKAIKYSEPSDNSFMGYVAQLGDQAKYLLRPHQRHAYEYFKYVPGYVVDGPWMQDSYGVPLQPRYLWYLEEVEPALSREIPDVETTYNDMALLKASLELEMSDIEAPREELIVPLFGDEDYLSSQVNSRFKVGGDPRLTDGKALVDVLNGLIEKGSVLPYELWYNEVYIPSLSIGDAVAGDIEGFFEQGEDPEVNDLEDDFDLGL